MDINERVAERYKKTMPVKHKRRVIRGLNRMRNKACWCGSTKKYKRCCYPNYPPGVEEYKSSVSLHDEG